MEKQRERARAGQKLSTGGVQLKAEFKAKTIRYGSSIVSKHILLAIKNTTLGQRFAI